MRTAPHRFHASCAHRAFGRTGPVGTSRHFGLSGAGARAWFGWPDIPQLEKLVTGGCARQIKPNGSSSPTRSRRSRSAKARMCLGENGFSRPPVARASAISLGSERRFLECESHVTGSNAPQLLKLAQTSCAQSRMQKPYARKPHLRLRGATWNEVESRDHPAAIKTRRLIRSPHRRGRGGAAEQKGRVFSRF